MDAPILLVVDEDPGVLEALSGDLARRFAADYQILAEPSPASALTVLERLAASSRQVALVVVGQQLAGTSGVDLLEAAHRLHPAAKRVLRLERGDYTAANPAVRAMTLGQIDHHLFTPWLPAERWLYRRSATSWPTGARPSRRRSRPSASSATNGSQGPISCGTS